MIPRLEAHTPLVRIQPNELGYIMVIETLSSDFYGYPFCQIARDGKSWKPAWHPIAAGRVFKDRPLSALFIASFPGTLVGISLENAQVVEDHWHNTLDESTWMNILQILQHGWLINENYHQTVIYLSKNSVKNSDDSLIIPKAAIPLVQDRRRFLVEAQWLANGLYQNE